MTGTGIDLIIIPVVTVVSLAVWLILVAHAAAHPNWDSGRSARGRAEGPVAVRTPAGDVPSDGRPAGPDTRHASAA
jgi:hypothetical protein